MANLWYANISGEELGPLSPSQLRNLALTGKLTPSSQVRKSGGSWAAASRVRGLFSSPPSLNPPSPPAAEELPSGWPALTVPVADIFEEEERAAARRAWESKRVPPPTACNPDPLPLPFSDEVASVKQATNPEQPVSRSVGEQLRIVFWAIIGAAIGAAIGQFSPGGLATMGEIGSPIRNEMAVKYGAVGLGAGIVIGVAMVLVGRNPENH